MIILAAAVLSNHVHKIRVSLQCAARFSFACEACLRCGVRTSPGV